MTVVRERRDHVEVLRIDRPEAKNAVNDVVAHALEDALDDVERDPAVRVVVLTGTGDTFSAGADLKMVAAGDSRGFVTQRGGFAGFVQRDFPKPVIAAVNGTAVAGGFEIALACDLIVAADTAVFGLFEVKRGLFAAGGGLIRLPRRVPLALAMEIAIIGTTIDAARAYSVGLVNRVVPAPEVLDTAITLADEIAANSPLAVRNSRRMVREAGDLSETEAWARSSELSREVFASPDSVEGATAFAEKRPPVWRTS
ncbi:MAG TPA: crotonase/enoyl-CoA hydratase family protein [Acidimicrobiia bacterium]|nr:crotonase/enoyl-CoA hydratase family protein [Acidimicrobiia bacterium]